MNSLTHFLSLDWGTTAFRLRLVDMPSLRILAEESSRQGTAVIHDAWKGAGSVEETRISFYQQHILEALHKVKTAAGKDLDGIPIVISGMASSTLGILEVPYGTLPFSLDGSDFKTETIPASSGFPHQCLVISGVKSDDDVMRGEEVQVVGCSIDNTTDQQVFVHPGTHSKHIVIQNGSAISFRTFMSGELFGLLSRHSILAASLEHNSHYDRPHNRQSFEEGVREGDAGPILHCLFKVRTGDLFKKRSREQAFHYLSGLIIGAELSAFPMSFSGNIILAGEPALVAQYKAAMDVLGITQKAKTVVIKDAVEITIRGQFEVFQRQQHAQLHKT